jgi:hypothetical protein
MSLPAVPERFCGGDQRVNNTNHVVGRGAAHSVVNVAARHVVSSTLNGTEHPSRSDDSSSSSSRSCQERVQPTPQLDDGESDRAWASATSDGSSSPSDSVNSIHSMDDFPSRTASGTIARRAIVRLQGAIPIDSRLLAAKAASFAHVKTTGRAVGVHARTATQHQAELAAQSRARLFVGVEAKVS